MDAHPAVSSFLLVSVVLTILLNILIRFF